MRACVWPRLSFRINGAWLREKYCTRNELHALLFAMSFVVNAAPCMYAVHFLSLYYGDQSDETS